MGCQKAQGYLEANALAVGERTDAGKARLGAEQALELARAARRVIVARGKKVVTFDMKRDPPDDQALLAHLLGPTGNLRAPTLRRGGTLLVGFSEQAYKQMLEG